MTFQTPRIEDHSIMLSSGGAHLLRKCSSPAVRYLFTSTLLPKKNPKPPFGNHSKQKRSNLGATIN